MEFELKDMSCNHCVRAITQAVTEVDPEARVEADLTSKRVRVLTSAAESEVAAALVEAGYPPS